MVKEALFFVLATLSLVATAQAEVSAENCEQLSRVILKNYVLIEESLKSNAGRLTKSQHSDVTELLQAACSPKFALCGYSYCKPKPEETSVSEGNQPTTLSWVTDEMSCEDFLGQLRVRFQVRNLSIEKREELKASLDLACGEKFKHCSFDACKGREK
jgi:hypothetical protein